MKRSKFLKALCAMMLLCIMIPAMASAATIDMAYNSGSLYLRTGPDRSYGTNGTVQDGDYVSVLSYGDIWSKVKTGDGRTGYIKNLYINDGDNYYASGTSYFSSRYDVYATAAVNLRAGASTNTSVIRTLAKGTKLRALGKNNGFYLVETADGTQGYVSGSYVSKSYVSGGSASSAAKYTRTVTASYVNMRSGGGLSYEVLKVLPYGTKVEVLYTGNYWTRVKHNGVTGWIKNIYLR